jgi:hypothetical protein
MPLIHNCLTLLALSLARPLPAQTAPLDTASLRISSEGVPRASALVDSVYVDRLLHQATIDGGDFTAYLMARLGVRDLPPDLGYRVTIDSTLIRIGGRIADLPPEARRALAQLVMLLPAETRLEAQVELLPAGKQAVRFHLRSATIQGVPVPEAFFAPLMSDIGSRYPALTATGRDLYVQLPAGAKMQLVPGGVTLTGP